MMDAYNYVNPASRLRRVKLRPTRRRIELIKLLFNGENRHVTAEQLHKEALQSKVRVSLATVYNTLHLFCDAGLLREVVVAQGASYYDTNTSDHHHLFHEETGELHDIPASVVRFESEPVAPAGTEIDGIDVTIRLRRIY